MTRSRGTLGFVSTSEASPGVWEQTVTEINVQMDILRNSQSIQNTSTINAQIDLLNRFSLVANDSTLENLEFLRYISFRGIKWNVSSFEVNKPRLIISVRGIYNGQPNST